MIITQIYRLFNGRNDYIGDDGVETDLDQDNEFELVFVIAYQKMLPLLYLDKLLDEIQLRWRWKKVELVSTENYVLGFGICSKKTCKLESSLKIILDLVQSLHGP